MGFHSASILLEAFLGMAWFSGRDHSPLHTLQHKLPFRATRSFFGPTPAFSTVLGDLLLEYCDTILPLHICMTLEHKSFPYTEGCCDLRCPNQQISQFSTHHCPFL